MFTGNKRFIAKAEKAKKILRDELLGGKATSRHVHWDFGEMDVDGKGTILSGIHSDVVTGRQVSASAILDYKGEAYIYSNSLNLDRDLDGILDIFISISSNVKSTKHLKKHLKAVNKPKNQDRIQYHLSIALGPNGDKGLGLAQFCDSLPGVSDPKSDDSTNVWISPNGIDGEMIFA